MMQHVGKNIKAIRISKLLKQQAIANAIGLSLTAYSNIESGKTQNITIQRLEQIAQVLDINIIVLLNNDPNAISAVIELQQTKDLLQQANKQIAVLERKGNLS